MNTLGTSNIKAIVFDFGGVIQFITGGDIKEDIAKIIEVSPQEFNQEYFKFNHLSNVNNLLWEDMILKVVAVFTNSNEHTDTILKRVNDFHMNKELNQELLSLIPSLKEQGYKIAVFSNYSSELRTVMKELTIDSLFDEIIISGEIGFQKPQKEAFDILFNKLNVLPQETVFIDDTKKSLEGADQIGYHPILFVGNKELKTDLNSIGITF